MDAKTGRPKFDQIQDTYIVSKYLLTKYLLIKNRKIVTLQKPDTILTSPVMAQIDIMHFLITLRKTLYFCCIPDKNNTT